MVWCSRSLADMGAIAIGPHRQRDFAVETQKRSTCDVLGTFFCHVVNWKQIAKTVKIVVQGCMPSRGHEHICPKFCIWLWFCVFSGNILPTLQR